MRVERASPGWPFRYRARQAFTLDEAGLTIGFSIENLEGPRGAGGARVAPFFVRDADTELACRLSGVWRTDPEVLPLQRVPVPAGMGFLPARAGSKG